MVSREDVLRRGRGDLHQQGDADRDAGYSWGTGAIEDEGDRCLYRKVVVCTGKV